MFAKVLRGVFRSRYCWLLCLIALPAAVAYSQRQSEATKRQADNRKTVEGAQTFRKIEEVIERWSPKQHLYVYGNLGVAQKQLTDLQKWLEANGPHWTVVLMEHGQNQAFTAPDGRNFRNLDAVEYALGFGLNNQTDFGKLEHPQTKESDGAVFVLFLKDRKFSYYSSDAQNRRNLGQADWIGKLDQPAFRAMRSGGRIVDAVKDTVKSINGKLEQAIASEKRAALQLQEQRQRDVNHARAVLRDLNVSVKEVERAAADFATSHPQAVGSLAKPPLTKWRDALERHEAELTSDTVRSIVQQSSSLAVETSRHLNAYAAVSDFNQHVEQLTVRLGEVEKSASPAAQALAKETRQLLENARKQLDAGELAFTDLLTQTEEKLRQAEALVEEEKAKAAMARLRANWIQGTIMAMLAILGIIVLCLLLLANRRRKPTKLRAIKELADREQSVVRETERLDSLFKRNEDILGSRESIEERGYSGTTRELALKAIDYVDDLFVMSKEVKRVLREAHALVAPSDPWNRLVNLFSPTRYQQAMDHVSGKPIKFSRTTGIPLIVRDMKFARATTGEGPDGQTGAQPVLEPLPDEISLTFEEIFGALQQRGIEAEQALSTIEECLTNVQDKLTHAQSQLEAAAAQEKQIDKVTADSYFDVPKYFTALIPAVQQNLQRADDLSAFDAVEAVHGPLAQAQRQLAEGTELGQRLLSAHEQLLPQLRERASALQQLGYTSTWITNELGRITAQADGLYESATTSSIAGATQELSITLQDLDQRTTQITQLAKQINETLTPALDDLGKRVAGARRELAATLQLGVEAVLHERDRDPDTSITLARSALDTAKTMLLQGRQTAVEEAITTFKSETASAQQLVVATQNAVQEYAAARKAIEQQCGEQQARAPELRTDIEAAKRAYAASALVIPSGIRTIDGNGKTGNQSKRAVDWWLSQAQEGATTVLRLLGTAESHRKAGEVLAAAEDLAKANAVLTVSGGQLQQIKSHLELLASQSRENAQQQQTNESLINNLIQAHRNPLVTKATLQAIEEASAVVAQNRSLVEVRQAAPNPFDSAKSLLNTRRQLEQLQAQIVGDQQANAEAKRALAGAMQQLQTARQLVRQSQTDRIPDSAEIIQANSRVSALARELDNLENELQVAHSDWRSTGSRAARLQSELAASEQTLGSELSAAHQALAAFQQASQIVLQAGQWSGSWGIRVPGSPGVHELERARYGLQTGNYQSVLQISQIALLAAQAAIQHAEREVMRRRLEEERAEEMARRIRETALRRHSSPTLGGGSWGSSSSGSFGSSYSGSSSSGNDSGFSRSGW